MTGILTVPYSPIRSAPSHKSEIRSQLVFGETYEAWDMGREWIRIRAHFDGYEGWIEKQHNTPWEEDYRSVAGRGFVINRNYNLRTTLGKIRIPAGSFIPLEGPLTGPSFTINGISYRFGEKSFPETGTIGGDKLEMCLEMLNAPYLWGGKTPWGMDCSGLSQLVYKLEGIAIPRDSWKQAEAGEEVPFLEQAEAGDLAFFDNPEGKVTHVGLLMGNDRIVHASGKVRVDSIDSQGIFREETGKYSHNLRVIKKISAS